jgi:hypothetical protein
VKILDFGIAKFYGSAEGSSGASETEQRHLTTVGKVLGTPVYMSPEQCNGAEQVDDRTDVYALGVIMYQLVSSKLPFDAPAACVIMAKHITEMPPLLAELRPELAPDICQLVHEMLAKSAKDRPPMAQVVKRLEGILESEHSLASSEWRSLYRMLPRGSRRRALPVPALLGGLLFFMVTVSLWKIGAQRRAQRAAAPPATAAATSPPAAPAQVVAAVAPPAASAPGPTATAPAATAPAATPAAPEEPKAAAGARKKKSAGAKRALASTGAAPASSSSDIPIFR